MKTVSDIKNKIIFDKIHSIIDKFNFNLSTADKQIYTIWFDNKYNDYLYIGNNYNDFYFLNLHTYFYYKEIEIYKLHNVFYQGTLNNCNNRVYSEDVFCFSDNNDDTYKQLSLHYKDSFEEFISIYKDLFSLNNF